MTPVTTGEPEYRRETPIMKNQILSLQAMDSQDDIELRAGSSLSINCKVVSTISVAVC